MNPLLRDFPEQFETERLVIRCPRAGDGLAVYQSVVETLAELRAWPASLPWAVHEPSYEVAETFCREGRVAYLARTRLPMLLFLKSDGAHVGSSGLQSIDWSVPKFEIGYWCRKSYQGRGLTTEAVKGIVDFAVQAFGARRIVSLADVANVPSRRVAERAGFVLEGVMRHERKAPDGTLRDTCLYAFTR